MPEARLGGEEWPTSSICVQRLELPSTAPLNAHLKLILLFQLNEKPSHYIKNLRPGKELATSPTAFNHTEFGLL